MAPQHKHQLEFYHEYAPLTSFTDSDSRSSQVLPQPLIVLRQPAQLQLGHGLLPPSQLSTGEYAEPHGPYEDEHS